MNFKFLNNVTGWAVFLIATTVYFLTLEPTSSLWDCGEYITAANKLEVGHPPGAPLFMAIGRLFSFFAAPEDVALWVNRCSSLTSSFTILFLFWSITLLAKKILYRNNDWGKGEQIAALGAGAVGALAYTFSDSFWFSAVEGEVYAMASMFTAIIFWAILKWDDEMIDKKNGELASNKNPLRWIILIVFLFGLAIGVHLLGLLVIPSVIFITYFRTTEKIKPIAFIVVGLISMYLLNLVQDVIIPNVIGNASKQEVLFVNTFGMPFNFGALFYFIGLLGLLLLPFITKKNLNIFYLYAFFLVSPLASIVSLFIKDEKKKFITVLIWSVSLILFNLGTANLLFYSLIIINLVIALFIYYSSDNPILAILSAFLGFIFGPIVFYGLIPKNSLLRSGKTNELYDITIKIQKFASMCLFVLLIGYGSFAIIVIRSNANTPLDENDPENLVTLESYLKREQYGSWPVFAGPYWNSNPKPREEWKDMSASNLRRFVIIDELAENEIKAFKSEADAIKYNKEHNNKYTIKEKYFVSNASIREHAIPTFEENVFFPRMFNGDDKGKLEAYKFWSDYTENVEKETRNGDISNLPIGTDGQRIPSYGENMKYMFKYQLTWMYWRYFMWNFAGRQNDIQGHGDIHRGNWKTGYSFLDNERIGDQANAPYYTKENKANNTYYLIPLILGVLGAIYHFMRNSKDAFVITLLFLLTGIAIIVFLNPKPLEPRERDYAYAGSFYAFAIWIGISVLAIYEAYKSLVKEDFLKMAKYAGFFSVLILIFTAFGTAAILKTWVLILVIAALFMAIPYFLRKTLNSSSGAMVATVLGLIAPFLMMKEGWDDHDRSGKTSAQDLAYNYLISCAPNSIIFTMGDNDTFPLWYMQEVEGKFTDMRVCNTSLFATDWYAEQMKMRAYESAPLPIKFREDQILMYAGSTDQVLFASPIQLAKMGGNKKSLEAIFKKMRNKNYNQYRQTVTNYLMTTSQVLSQTKPSEQIAADPAMKSKIEQDIAQFAKDFSINVDSATFDQLLKIDEQTTAMIELANNGMITLPMQSPEFQQMQGMLNTWTNSWTVMPLDEAMAYVRDDKNVLINEGREARVIPASSFSFKVNVKNAIKSQVISSKEEAMCEKEITFSMEDVQGVGKADLLILDIIANNNWERGIYFSSPGGSDVAGALYKSGFLKENGMAWELSPIRSKSQLPVNAEKMYKNLMEVYKFGDLKNPNVLTDYYARRQTQQFRSMFAQLAEYYMVEVDNLESGMNSVAGRTAQFRAAGMIKEADSIDNIYKNAPSTIREYKDKTKKLIMRCMEIMPLETVLDNGESANMGRALPAELGEGLREYSDGNVHDFVGLLYRAGAKKEAEALGMKVADQLESIINFYVENESANVFFHINQNDLCAAVLNYAKMMRFANDQKIGNPNGKYAMRMKSYMSKFYKTGLPKIITYYNDTHEDTDQSAELKRTLNAYNLMYEITGDAELPMPTQQNVNQQLQSPADKPALTQPVQIDCTNGTGGAQ